MVALGVGAVRAEFVGYCNSASTTAIFGLLRKTGLARTDTGLSTGETITLTFFFVNHHHCLLLQE